jgi:hypothetical protein
MVLLRVPGTVTRQVSRTLGHLGEGVSTNYLSVPSTYNISTSRVYTL